MVVSPLHAWRPRPDKPLEENQFNVQIDATWRTRAQVRRVVAGAAIAAALVLLRPMAAGQTVQSGSITGRVAITARVRGVGLPTNAYSPRAVSLHESQPIPEMRSVVVYLKDAAFRAALPVMRAQIRQEHESFSPRVVAITRGSWVDFPNGDPYFHNVFSLSGAGFDLGRYPDGQSRARQFNRAGLVKVYCHIHSQMSASILVLDHPYFATPGDDGVFSLPNVPAGDYKLVAWHERVGERVTRLSVHAGRATTVEIALPVGDTP